jgi:hypothetical protein
LTEQRNRREDNAGEQATSHVAASWLA